MRLRTLLLFVLITFSCMIFCLIMFPALGVNVEITLIPVVGLGSWLFGRRFGLLIIIPIMVYSYFLQGPIYGDRLVYYEAKGGGIIIMVITASLIGNIRSNYEALKTANINLDRRVEERNTELGILTAKLINGAELTRIHHGQILHDGIGQLLTGVQLFCTSLAEQLVDERNPNASIAYSMSSKAKTAHDIIRKTARMLFPVRMHETGLIPAINELMSCFNEIEHLSVMLEVNGDFQGLPDGLALGVYRICHESAICAASALNASAIHLGLNEDASGYQVTIRHNGDAWSQLNENTEQRLILYRLHSIGGTVSTDHFANGFEAIMYHLPKV